ncbi:MAG TPA: alpha/beta hydrolase [Chloroflexota bacterium]|nr:alpha/beta hydrolase [Chloroflexota bacterium]
MPYLRRGELSIYYETKGSGFPLLLLPPGGMNATIESWETSAFNPMEIFSREYWTITLDQRNAGRSTGPLDVDDPWGSYAQDHLNLMNHLGIGQFCVLGCCIGCSYALKLVERAPERVVCAVIEQPVGISEENREVLPNALAGRWAKDLLEQRPSLDPAQLDAFRQRMFGGDFVFSVSREFVRSCETPMLVMPGNNLDHPTAIGREIASLAPNSETLEDWRYPSDVVPNTVARIWKFLRAHPAA